MLRWLRDALIAERTVVSVILLGTVAVVLQTPDGSRPALASPWFWVDVACVLFFALEAALKIGRDGLRGYRADGWNRLDFLVLLLSLPILLTPWIDLRHLSVVVLLRLGRLFRLFRLLRFIPNRDHLLTGLWRALRASVGVFLALLLLNFILAMGGTLLFGQLSPEFFGNPLRAAYSMFQVFTLDGWYDIAESLAQSSEHPVWAAAARAYLVLAVVMGGLLGLSLANAVFVDEMTLDNTDGLERKIDALDLEIREIRRQLEILGRAAQDRAEPRPAAAPEDD